MNRPSLFACSNPRGWHWQLGDIGSAPCTVALLGWSGFDNVDSGVPPQVAKFLSESFTETARVTFLSTEITNADDNAEAASHRIATGPVQALALAFGVSRPIHAVATTRATILQRAFEDSGCPWWLQRQVLVGTALDAPSFVPSRDQLNALTGDGWFCSIPGVLWIVRPGVDGDIAGLCASSPVIAQNLMSALSKNCTAAGIAWDVLDETAFADRLAAS